MALSRPSLIALLPAALLAQQAAPPSQAAAYSAAKAGIEAQMKEDPDKAQTMAEALIPPQKPAFDKSTPQLLNTSISEANALKDTYSLAANAASAAGQWEKSRDYAVRAQDTAKALYADALPPLRQQQDAWKGALEKSQKATEEAKGLEAKTPRTPEEDKALASYTANKAIHDFNLLNGPKQVQAIEKALGILNDQTHDYDKYIESVDARLKTEQGDLEKFKGDKGKYAAAGLKEVGKVADKEKALALLHRLRFLDPSNAAITHKIDVLLGKAQEVPEKAAKPVHHKKAKG